MPCYRRAPAMSPSKYTERNNPRHDCGPEVGVGVSLQAREWRSTAELTYRVHRNALPTVSEMVPVAHGRHESRHEALACCACIAFTSLATFGLDTTQNRASGAKNIHGVRCCWQTLQHICECARQRAIFREFHLPRKEPCYRSSCLVFI